MRIEKILPCFVARSERQRLQIFMRRVVEPAAARSRRRETASIHRRGGRRVLNEKLWTVVYGPQLGIVLPTVEEIIWLGFARRRVSSWLFLSSASFESLVLVVLTLASLFPLRSKKLKLTKKYFDDLAKNESRSGKWNAIGGGLYASDVNFLNFRLC